MLIVPGFSAYAPDQLIVQYKTSIVPALSIAGVKVQKISPLFKEVSPAVKTVTLKSGEIRTLPDLSNIYIIHLAENIDIEKTLEEIKKDPNVIYAEPNYRVQALKTPNDPYYSQQWFYPKIKAPETWDITIGSALVVAVIDTGADYNHADLLTKVISGYDYVNNDSNPMDDNGHGTHVAGLIGALTNNSVGVAGTSWGSKILAIKVLDSNGSGYISDVAQGIQYAADNGASVLNMSFGDYSNSSTLSTAVDYAYQKGCTLVAAAGNENTSSPIYPAAYDKVIAVAATDQHDKRSVWSGSNSASNYGTWVDISAPGTDIYSTWWPNNSYHSNHGTSMASPIVAGTIALLLSISPTLSQSEILSRLKNTAENIDALNPGYAGLLGSGRLNANLALGYPTANITSPASGSIVADTVPIQGTASGISFASYTLDLGLGSSPSSYDYVITNSQTKIDGGVLGSSNTKNYTDGLYSIRLRTTSTDHVTAESQTTITIDNTFPLVQITSPVNGADITDTITIEGTAYDQNFSYYILEYQAPLSTEYIRITGKTSTVSAESLGIWKTSGLSGLYKIRLTALDKVGHQSQAQISVNLINTSLSSTNLQQLAKASPNPFTPGQDGTAYFYYKLSENHAVDIYLFDLTGNLIWEKSYAAGQEGGKAGDNLVPWNGKNMFGEMVASGVYLYKIVSNQTSQKTVIGKNKIIVLR